MSIDAKVSFMNQTEKSLATRITADMMSSVMKVIADVLDGYEMRETFTDENRNDDLLESYIAALKVQGRSPKTIERYKFVIGRMTKEIGIPTRRITVYHLRSYLAAEQERGMADTSVEGTRRNLPEVPCEGKEGVRGWPGQRDHLHGTGRKHESQYECDCPGG